MNDKIIFQQGEQAAEPQRFQPKQQFDPNQVQIEPEQPLEGELLETQFDAALQHKPSLWRRGLMALSALFLLACVAQSAQWLWDSWQQKQWIYFAFALVACGLIGLGVAAIGNEFARLRKLRRHILLQQQSQVWQGQHAHKSAVQFEPSFDGEQAKGFCLQIAKNMGLDQHHPNLTQWQNQLSEAHSAQEISWLFSQNVLQPIDQQAQKLISQNALESAVVVSLSPLALVDMFFIAWRNIRLINQIADLYGMELGYFSRLRLMKLVLLNMAFTGATELAQEVGMDWLSQDLTAKLSVRAAQGIGAGILTARLGIKAMEFCRPFAFQGQQKPRLSQIHRQLLSQLKSQILGGSKIKQSEKL